jgi:hypothetical protein
MAWCSIKAQGLVKKFSAFYGTRWFIAVSTRARHWILFSSSWVHSIPSNPALLRSVLILLCNPRLFPKQCLYIYIWIFKAPPCVVHPLLSHWPWFDRTNHIGEEYKLRSSSCDFFHPLVLISNLFSNVLNLFSSLRARDKVHTRIAWRWLIHKMSERFAVCRNTHK